MFNDNIKTWVKDMFCEKVEAQGHVLWCISVLECSKSDSSTTR